jgi:hypothetical protein
LFTGFPDRLVDVDRALAGVGADHAAVGALNQPGAHVPADLETLKDGSDTYGNRVRVKAVKNKVAPPFKQAEFDILFGSGIDSHGSLLDLGLQLKLVAKSGSHYSYAGSGSGRGNARLRPGSPQSLNSPPS